MANEDTRDLFLLRARVVAAVRRFLDEHGFVEVETPVLQPLYGGAMARPFTTHYNALDSTFYLRIATELYLKRLIVGGLERVYELGKDFRNEGLSPKHNPEFTMVEFYEAYADYKVIAERCEQLVAYAAHQVDYAGPLDFTPPWRRETLQDAIRDRTGIDVLAHRERDTLQREMRGQGPGGATGGHVGPARRRPALHATSSPTCISRRSCSITRSSCRPSPRATGRSTAWSSASRPSPAASRSPTPSPSSTTPTSSAPASRSRPAPRPPETRRRTRTTRASCARSSTACRPPAASGSASTGS